MRTSMKDLMKTMAATVVLRGACLHGVPGVSALFERGCLMAPSRGP